MSDDARPAGEPLRPRPSGPAGRVVEFTHQSELLAANPLGDPATRAHPVYLPPGYDDGDCHYHYPVLWCLAAYTSAGPAQVNWRNHGESLPARLDRLIAGGHMPPVIAVFPDCYTSLGGNQYVNSPSLGAYADFLCRELVPAVDERFRTIAEPAGRAVFGKSSGGFGALHLAMEHPGVWQAVASHAGDCGFDRVYPADFPVCRGTLAEFDDDIEAFVRAFWRKQRPAGTDFQTMMTLCLAASYSPDGERPLGLALPFELRYCRRDEAVWQCWLAFDPLEAAARRVDALQSLAGLWIDAGDRDQYFIQYGTLELHDRLDALGVAHVHETFEGTHSGIDWRYDHSLPWLAACLKAD